MERFYQPVRWLRMSNPPLVLYADKNLTKTVEDLEISGIQVGETLIKTLWLKNESPYTFAELSIEYENAEFEFQFEKTILDPQETTEVTLVFAPIEGFEHQLGQFTIKSVMLL
jgi:hypothetical protein